MLISIENCIFLHKNLKPDKKKVMLSNIIRQNQTLPTIKYLEK